MITDQLLVALILISSLGCGLVAGIFFAFSVFVMKALERLPPRDGIAAMQSINVTVLNPWFLGVFFGTAAACLTAVIWSLSRWNEPGAEYLLAGGVLYLVGCFLVTIVFNVPRNEALASIGPSDSHVEKRWAGYVVTWTRWNHVRTVAAFAGAASFAVALSQGGFT